MKRFANTLLLLALFIGSAFATDFPLTAHIISTENILAGKRVEASVGNTTFILNAIVVRDFTVTAGADYPARLARHQRADQFQLLIPDKNGTPKPHWFMVVGRKEQ